VVLWGRLANPIPSPLSRALRAYHQLDLSGGPQIPAPRLEARRAVRLSAIQVGRLAERYQSGATVYDLAAEFGIRRDTVAQRLKKAGVTLQPQSPTSTDVDEMARLYATGLPLAAVGRRLGFDAETIRQHLLAYAVRTRDAPGREHC
jgi:hypothetical protein